MRLHVSTVNGLTVMAYHIRESNYRPPSTLCPLLLQTETVHIFWYLKPSVCIMGSAVWLPPVVQKKEKHGGTVVEFILCHHGQGHHPDAQKQQPTGSTDVGCAILNAARQQNSVHDRTYRGRRVFLRLSGEACFDWRAVRPQENLLSGVCCLLRLPGVEGPFYAGVRRSVLKKSSFILCHHFISVHFVGQPKNRSPFVLASALSMNREREERYRERLGYPVALAFLPTPLVHRFFLCRCALNFCAGRSRLMSRESLPWRR